MRKEEWFDGGGGGASAAARLRSAREGEKSVESDGEGGWVGNEG